MLYTHIKTNINLDDTLRAIFNQIIFDKAYWLYENLTNEQMIDLAKCVFDFVQNLYSKEMELKNTIYNCNTIDELKEIQFNIL